MLLVKIKESTQKESGGTEKARAREESNAGLGRGREEGGGVIRERVERG